MEEEEPLPKKSARPVPANEPAAQRIRSVANVGAGGELALAFDGYCVASMVERGEMVRGKPEHEVVFAGKRFRFASARKKEAFEAEPPKYLPAEKGRCPVTFGDTGHWRDGDIRFPAIYAGRVFFLADEAKRKKFLLNPEAYVDDGGRALRMSPPREP
jgi:YHS domain-containing protein